MELKNMALYHHSKFISIGHRPITLHGHNASLVQKGVGVKVQSLVYTFTVNCYHKEASLDKQHGRAAYQHADLQLS